MPITHCWPFYIKWRHRDLPLRPWLADRYTTRTKKTKRKQPSKTMLLNNNNLNHRQSHRQRTQMSRFTHTALTTFVLFIVLGHTEGGAIQKGTVDGQSLDRTGAHGLCMRKKGNINIIYSIFTLKIPFETYGSRRCCSNNCSD